MCTYLSIYRERERDLSLSLSISISLSMYIYIYIHMNTYTHLSLSLYIYICMYIYIYIYMYVCVYIYIYIYIFVREGSPARNSPTALQGRIRDSECAWISDGSLVGWMAGDMLGSQARSRVRVTCMDLFPWGNQISYVNIAHIALGGS